MKHDSMHQGHKEHNKRVSEFHKKHAAQVANGENGTGWLAKLETSFFHKVLVPLKIVK